MTGFCPVVVRDHVGGHLQILRFVSKSRDGRMKILAASARIDKQAPYEERFVTGYPLSVVMSPPPLWRAEWRPSSCGCASRRRWETASTAGAYVGSADGIESGSRAGDIGMGGGHYDVDAWSGDVQCVDSHRSGISARRTRLLVDDDADAARKREGKVWVGGKD
jgi:hypothetical protein